MKKIVLVLLAGVLFYSCSVTKYQNRIAGRFSGYIYFAGEMTLTLQIDGSYTMKPSEVKDQISWLDHIGQWEILDKEHILLKNGIRTNTKFGTNMENTTLRIIDKNTLEFPMFESILKRQ